MLDIKIKISKFEKNNDELSICFANTTATDPNPKLKYFLKVTTKNANSELFNISKNLSSFSMSYSSVFGKNSQLNVSICIMPKMNETICSKAINVDLLACKGLVTSVVR